MAGIWNRVWKGGLDGQGYGRVNVLQLTVLIKADLANILDPFRARQSLDTTLAENGYPPLTDEEAQDIGAILGEVGDKPDATAKLLYVVGTVEPIMYLAELDLTDETEFRLELGI